jgi:uncharacterized membrane protein
MLATSAVTALVGALLRPMARAGGAGGSLAWVVQACIGLYFGAGLLTMALAAARGREVRFSQLFEGYPHVPSLFVSMLVSSVLVFAGLLLLIVPGVYLMLMFLFYGHCIVDRSLGPFRGLGMSVSVTRGIKLSLLAVLFLVILLNFLGLLCLGVGLLVTTPITLVTVAHCYCQVADRGGAL